MTYTAEVGTCHCHSCESGIITAGHCVDIDGDWGHECKALEGQT
jgi:hypothetical protein